MITINPHVNFNGNTQEAFTFYQSVFWWTLTDIIRFWDLASEEFPVAAEDVQKLMSIALPIGPTKLQWNDVPSFMGKTMRTKIDQKSSSPWTICEAQDIFDKLSVWWSVEFPLGESWWGKYFAMFRDKYWVEWMIDCTTWVLFKHDWYIGYFILFLKCYD